MIKIAGLLEGYAMSERQSRSVSRLLSIAEGEARRGVVDQGISHGPWRSCVMLRHTILKQATWPLYRVRHLLRSHETSNSVGKDARRSIVIINYHIMIRRRS
jgi:hypothetical protein